MGSGEGRLSAVAPPLEKGVTARLRVAYVMSRFPKITETFVLHEMLALEELGAEVEVYPLLREVEKVAHDEARALVERAHYTPWISGAIVASHLHFLARAPFTYVRTLAAVLARTVKSPNYLGGALVFWPKIVHMARSMQRQGVEHLHAHFANHPALAALIVHRLTGIPYSFTAHGSDLHVDQTALGWKLSEAEFAVTVSNYNKEFVRERAGDAAADKLRVIHCGVDGSLYTREREPLGTVLEILCIAALREVKGHRHLIDACQLLKSRGRPFHLHLVGGGPLERKIREHVSAAGLSTEVTMHGPLEKQRLIARLRAAHVLVLPSILDREGRREGIPVTLMEAMSCGLPVVTSRISGIPELVEHERSGLLVPPGDAAGIAAALERLADSSDLRRELGEAARARVQAEFDLRDGARRLAREILAHRR